MFPLNTHKITITQKNIFISFPAVKMWKGHEKQLIAYIEAICDEWTKRGYKDTVKEKIQEYKEVIIEDLTTGEMFTGPEAREKIGLPYGSRGVVKPNPIPGCRVWVQSSSNNRILREKGFLYEVPDK